MTSFDKMVWAAAYAESLARQREKGPGASRSAYGTRGCVRDAIGDADEAVLVLRDVMKADGRLHMSETLEQERLAEEV